MFRPLVIAGLMIATPVVAQTQMQTPSPATQQDDAIAAQTAAGVAAANRDIGAEARMQTGAAAAVNVANEARYRNDVRRYRAAVRARRQTIAADAAVQNDRERAYAMAMADWRAQVAACKRGHSRACNRPSPDPQNYM